MKAIHCKPDEAMRKLDAVLARCNDGKLHRVRQGLYYWQAEDGVMWSIEQRFDMPGSVGMWLAEEDKVGGTYLDLLPTLKHVKQALGIA